MRNFVRLLLALILFLPATSAAQVRGLVGACQAVTDELGSTCLVAAAAVEAVQPQVGMLIAGGNPTIGTASGAGLRLGILPRVSATVKANLVLARIPDLRANRTGATDGIEYGDMSIAAPALSGTATVGLLPGLSAAPTIGGIGSIDLLGSASWLPLRTFAGDEFRSGSGDIAWGGGVRVGLVRESFTMPGASVSLMYHSLGEVGWGEICSPRVVTSSETGPGYRLEEGECPDVAVAGADRGNLGEFRFDLSSWSTRAALSKHLLGLGLTAGIGYDRLSSEVALAVQRPEGGFGDPVGPYPYAGIRDVELSQGRWSAFVDGSFSILVATFAVEAGWMQGDDAVPGYPDESSDFDPGDGTLFGSLGVRVAL